MEEGTRPLRLRQKFSLPRVGGEVLSHGWVYSGELLKYPMETGRPTASNQPTNSPEALWDATDVARYLRVSKSWVYHRAESGDLPSLRIGGLRRFEPEAIRAYARGEFPNPAPVIPLHRKRKG